MKKCCGLNCVEVSANLAAAIHVDDEPLIEILNDLGGAFTSSTLPTEMLGHVYEQYLDNAIRRAGHNAFVEVNRGVRKASGIYYTPPDIVDYIVKHTVGRALEGKSPAEAAGVKILDPACGGGVFLLRAYEFVLDWHRAHYVEDGPTKHCNEIFRGRDGDWHLARGEKKHILVNNIFGVDVDPCAVELSRLSLLLKVLEAEFDEAAEAQGVLETAMVCENLTATYAAATRSSARTSTTANR